MPIKVIFIHTLALWCQQNKVNGRALKLCEKFSFYNTSWSRILNSSGGYSGGSSGLDDRPAPTESSLRITQATERPWKNFSGQQLPFVPHTVVQRATTEWWMMIALNMAMKDITIYVLLPHAVNCGRFCFGAVSLWFFVCVWNISGTAERICAKFIWKTCLVRRSEEFEGQGQRSKIKVHGQKTTFLGPFGGLLAYYIW